MYCFSLCRLNFHAIREFYLDCNKDIAIIKHPKTNKFCLGNWTLPAPIFTPRHKSHPAALQAKEDSPFKSTLAYSRLVLALF